MKVRYFYLVIIVLLSIAISSNANEKSISVTRNLTSMPLAFTENLGQWDEEVLYRANAGGAIMWFTKDGAVYQFTRTIESDDNQISVIDKRYGLPQDGGRQMSTSAPFDDSKPDSIESIAIKANFIGSNPNPQMVGLEEMEYKCNYFIGNDPNEWHTDVSNYQVITYEEIYDGIDLKYYGNGTHMEYDFIVSPGADFSQINIQYEGAKSIAVNEHGELVVTTIWGEVVEQRPVVYQVENNNRISVEGIYKIQADNSFSFELNDYNTTLPLVIDPVLEYSTYLGGSLSDWGWGIAVDSFGSAYVTGHTGSIDFPKLYPYQETLQGNISVFVTKFSSSGDSLIYSTYLGGTDGGNIGYAIAVHASGSAYVTGKTYSTDFPTQNPYQGNQDSVDVFVTKLSSLGDSLIYSTYLGGNGSDVGWGIAVDSFGSAYVTGYTYSSYFPTLNPYQGTLQGNASAFVTKFSNSGDNLIYSTYLGGFSLGNGIAVDASGSAYVTGSTASVNFPIQNPYQETRKGGYDAFVTKFSDSGDSLIYSTYLGGTDADFSYGIAVDASGSAYVTGRTESTDFPIEKPYQGTYQGGYDDAFVTKLSISGDSLIYSTYLGSTDSDFSNGIAVDSFGLAFVTGYTASYNFPIESPYQGTFQGGYSDAFVTKFSNSGDSLIYSTYLGGSDSEQGIGITVDASGSAYVTGETNSNDFLTTPNAYDTSYNHGGDAFVTKFSQESCCNLRGDVLHDNGLILINDLVFLVNHVFKGGPPPICPEEGDITPIDGEILINDLVYLVNAVFKGGPQPPPC